MHITIKNKKVYICDYSVKCAIGKRGIGIKKKEGDNITPKGKYKIKYILYRKDRVLKFVSNINKIVITKNMGWCNDPKSRYYNKLIRYPFKHSAERLYKKDNTYDIVLVINFNFYPILKGKGSAIFIHVAKKKYQNTAGCVAINKKDLKNLIKKINKKTIINII